MQEMLRTDKAERAQSTRCWAQNLQKETDAAGAALLKQKSEVDILQPCVLGHLLREQCFRNASHGVLSCFVAARSHSHIFAEACVLRLVSLPQQHGMGYKGCSTHQSTSSTCYHYQGYLFTADVAWLLLR